MLSGLSGAGRTTALAALEDLGYFTADNVPPALWEALVRQADPVLQHGIPFMQELVAQTGLDCVVSALHGNQLLDTHREMGQNPATLGHGRGRPRPLFKGGAPKVILAGWTPAALHKLFDTHTVDEPPENSSPKFGARTECW